MVSGINDTKGHYFIWLIVTIILVAGLFVLMSRAAAEFPKGMFDDRTIWTALYVLPYIVGVFPLGVAASRRFLHGYVHVPTERIRVFETNIVVATFWLVVCEVCFVINLFLLAFYILMSVLVGILFTPYFVISGIILMVLKKI